MSEQQKRKTDWNSVAMIVAGLLVVFGGFVFEGPNADAGDVLLLPLLGVGIFWLAWFGVFDWNL